MIGDGTLSTAGSEDASGKEKSAVVHGGHGSRFGGLFYSKSDEKFTVRALLDEILGDRQFDRALDIGPGQGHVSEPLARRSRSITMIEKSAEFEAILHQRFDNAAVVIAPISEVELNERFDVILFSHVLYYQPCQDWLPLTRKLHSMLAPGGELIILLNADCGDWWKIVSQFWEDLRPHMGFHYIPLTEFRQSLAEMGTIKTHPYRYQMWIDGGLSWGDFVAREILELTDEHLVKRNEQRFQEFTKPFKQVDGSFVLDMRAEIIRIAASKNT